MYEELLKALEAGGYNAAPSRLRQGSVFLGYDPDWSEHEWDLCYVRISGDVGYRPYPPTEFYGNEQPRTPEQIQEVVDAAHAYALRDYDPTCVR